MGSIWSGTTDIQHFEQLKEDIDTDVLIIGGGMAGILCAYFLQQAGVDYALVEGGRIGNGITKNTTAKITSQHGLIYQKLLKEHGDEKAGMYLRANELAVEKFRELCRKIPCGFEEKSAYVYSLNDRDAIEREVAVVHALGHSAQFIQEIPLPFKIQGAIRFERQAQFHPLKFIAGIAKGLVIYENTFVTELAKNVAITKHAKIKAKNIVVATHFPFLNKHGGYFLKLYQHRSYAIALKNGPDINGMYLQETIDGLSFRNYEDMLIIGGGDHRTGKHGGNWRALREFAQKNYPGCEETYAWATQDCMSLDAVPYIGKYSKSSEHLYVAAGFNKWGMTSSMVAALVLTDMLRGRKNEFAGVFFPSRSILKPQLFVNGCTAIGNLLTPSQRRCPHMGCALKWNPVERTWDCACHGSRFERDGKLIDNPATGGAGY